MFGYTNAGKSTLINALVGEKVSIVSPRPQTTQKRILGVLTKGPAQIVFCDTPGIHPIKNKLDKFMEWEIEETIPGLQGALFLVDSTIIDPEKDRAFLEKLFAGADFPIGLCISKTDISSEEKRRKIIGEYRKFGNFSEIFEVSALRKKNLDLLLRTMLAWLPSGTHAYDSDYFTTQTEREIASETIREAAFQVLYHEVPHSLAVLIEEFKERANGKTYIQANLVLEKESQKKILIGTNGQGIKKLGVISREELNRTLGRDIFLELWVKVRPNWRKHSEMVGQMGYK